MGRSRALRGHGLNVCVIKGAVVGGCICHWQGDRRSCHEEQSGPHYTAARKGSTSLVSLQVTAALPNGSSSGAKCGSRSVGGVEYVVSHAVLLCVC